LTFPARRAILRLFAAGDEMTEARWLPRVVQWIAWAAVIAALVIASSASTSLAKQRDKTKSAPAAKSGPPPGETVNACGCYHDAKGGCVCTDKKAKCECPGECEPIGCGEKRDKEIEREMAAEIKRAQDDEKRRNEEAEADDAKARNGGAPDASAAPPEAAAPKAKATRKDSKADKK
jgi:hypothetical protein